MEIRVININDQHCYHKIKRQALCHLDETLIRAILKSREVSIKLIPGNLMGGKRVITKNYGMLFC